jgi:protein-disulfide isomerase
MTIACLYARLGLHKFRVIALVTLSILSIARPDLYAQNAAAVVNGEAITQDQLNAAIQTQLDTINQQISSLKQTALNRLIDNLLVEQAAKAEGVSVQRFLAEHVEHVTVQDAEVNDAYEKSKSQFPATLVPEAKYRIRRSLEDARRADAMRSLLQDLRHNASIINVLLDNISSSLDLKDGEGPSLGNPDAPVTVVVFNDFECPFCRNAAPVIRKAAEAWAGKVRVVIKNFPLEIHGNAFNAAKASFCAARQGRFWEFFDEAFARTDGLTESVLLKVGDKIGLEKTPFRSCIASADAEHAVQRDLELARGAGVNATPTIFVNKRKLNNVSELDGAIRQAISTAVSAKR